MFKASIFVLMVTVLLCNGAPADERMKDMNCGSGYKYTDEGLCASGKQTCPNGIDRFFCPTSSLIEQKMEAIIKADPLKFWTGLMKQFNRSELNPESSIADTSVVFFKADVMAAEWIIKDVTQFAQQGISQFSSQDALIDEYDASKECSKLAPLIPKESCTTYKTLSHPNHIARIIPFVHPLKMDTFTCPGEVDKFICSSFIQLVTKLFG